MGFEHRVSLGHISLVDRFSRFGKFSPKLKVVEIDIFKRFKVC